ncbi:hypothetical protein OG21DRAFT_1507849 [Imleria badia]|nr:hypothetical protein OG21DRAFT_1507849 [Imleria badia]
MSCSRTSATIALFHPPFVPLTSHFSIVLATPLFYPAGGGGCTYRQQIKSCTQIF